MKSTLRFLTLVLALVLVRANDNGHGNGTANNECEDLNKTIHSHQRHKTEGSWVLVWGVSDGPKGLDLLPKVTSQHLTLRILDNNTLHYDEKNFYRGQMWNCSRFVLNAMAVEGKDEDHFDLKSDGGTIEYEGKKGPLLDNVTLSFYPSSDHSLQMVYRSPLWDNYFLIYKREGHLTDAEPKEKEPYQKRAKCLGFPTEPAFVYDGSLEFCHMTSSSTNADS